MVVVSFLPLVAHGLPLIQGAEALKIMDITWAVIVEEIQVDDCWNTISLVSQDLTWATSAPSALTWRIAYTNRQAADSREVPGVLRPSLLLKTS